MYAVGNTCYRFWLSSQTFSYPTVVQLLLKLCSKLYCEIQGHSVGVFVLHSKSIQVSLYVLLVYSREKKKACRHFALLYMHWTLVNLLKACRSLANVSLWYLWRSIKYCACVMKLVLCCEIVCGRHYDIEKKLTGVLDWCTHIAIDLLLWCWGTIVRRCSTSGDSGDSAKYVRLSPSGNVCTFLYAKMIHEKQEHWWK